MEIISSLPWLSSFPTPSPYTLLLPCPLQLQRSNLSCFPLLLHCIVSSVFCLKSFSLPLEQGLFPIRFPHLFCWFLAGFLVLLVGGATWSFTEIPKERLETGGAVLLMSMHMKRLKSVTMTQSQDQSIFKKKKIYVSLGYCIRDILLLIE